MVKILAQAGNSLADVYDVEGSIAGIDQLLTQELPIVHEMGKTVFSERFSLSFRRSNTLALLQSTSFDVIMTDLPAFISRILGIVVFADVPSGRVANCTVSLRDAAAGREMPIWSWDAGFDQEPTVRIDDDRTGAITDMVQLRPTSPLENLPSMMASTPQPQQINEIAFRGVTTAFGAGLVIISLIVMIGHTHIGGAGISSRGLPVPSW